MMYDARGAIFQLNHLLTAAWAGSIIAPAHAVQIEAPLLTIQLLDVRTVFSNIID